MLAVVWHYWIGVSVVALAVVVTVATVGGYLKKVVSPRYPDKR